MSELFNRFAEIPEYSDPRVGPLRELLIKLETLKSTDVPSTSGMIELIDAIDIDRSMALYSESHNRVYKESSNLRNLIYRLSFKNYKTHPGGVDYV